MESPFAKTNTIIMYLEPYLNTYHKTYQNILTFNDMPLGPLSDMVTAIKTNRLSVFQEPGPFHSNPFNCTYVLLRYPKRGFPSNGCVKQTDCYMSADDIPSVLSYLEENHYKVEMIHHQLVHLLGGISETKFSGNRKPICSFSRIETGR